MKICESERDWNCCRDYLYILKIDWIDQDCSRKLSIVV